jgi:hypothetical protein
MNMMTFDKCSSYIKFAFSINTSQSLAQRIIHNISNMLAYPCICNTQFVHLALANYSENSQHIG